MGINSYQPSFSAIFKVPVRNLDKKAYNAIYENLRSGKESTLKPTWQTSDGNLRLSGSPENDAHNINFFTKLGVDFSFRDTKSNSNEFKKM